MSHIRILPWSLMGTCFRSGSSSNLNASAQDSDPMSGPKVALTFPNELLHSNVLCSLLFLPGAPFPHPPHFCPHLHQASLQHPSLRLQTFRLRNLRSPPDPHQASAMHSWGPLSPSSHSTDLVSLFPLLNCQLSQGRGLCLVVSSPVTSLSVV